MEITEKQVYEAMGMTPPEEEPGAQQPAGANEPGAAAPAAEETNGTPEDGTDGSKGSADAAGTNPEGKSAQEPGGQSGGADGAEDGEPEEKKEQTPDERKAHAAARRRAEQQAAEQEKMQRAIDEQIQKIHALEPAVNSVEDLLKIPENEAFYDCVKNRGMSFYDAYLIATRERREKNLAEAARTQALTNQRGKDHLTGAGAARGAGGRTVTSEEIAQFRVFNPTATEAEIRAWIEKHPK